MRVDLELWDELGPKAARVEFHTLPRKDEVVLHNEQQWVVQKIIHESGDRQIGVPLPRLILRRWL